MDLDLNVLAPLGTLTAGLLTIAGTFARSATASFERIAAVIPAIQTELQLGREERIELRRQLETERSSADRMRREAELVAQIGELGDVVSDRRLDEIAGALKRLVERRRATSDRPSPPPPSDSDPAMGAAPAPGPAPPSRPAPRSTRR